MHANDAPAVKVCLSQAFVPENFLMNSIHKIVIHLNNYFNIHFCQCPFSQWWRPVIYCHTLVFHHMNSSRCLISFESQVELPSKGLHHE